MWKTISKKTTKLDIDKLPLETSADDENNDDELGDDSISEGTSKIKKRSRARIIRSAWFNIDSQPEKHYRELIMLFTPWRNEETDLISLSHGRYFRQFWGTATFTSESLHTARCNSLYL